MMNKIVFDFDGTLLDSRNRHVVVLKECLQQFDLNYTNLDEYLKFKANGKSTEYFLREKLMLPQDLSKEISLCWIENIEMGKYLEMDYLYSDAISTLQLFTKNADLFLLSARSKESEFISQVKRLGIKPYFKEVICVSPQKASLRKAEVLHRIKPSIVVGDTEVDYESAQSVGAFCYLLNRGFRSKWFFDKKGIPSYDDLGQLPIMFDVSVNRLLNI